MRSFSRLPVLSTKEGNSAFRRTRRHLLCPRSTRPLARQEPLPKASTAAEKFGPRYHTRYHWAACGSCEYTIRTYASRLLRARLEVELELELIRGPTHITQTDARVPRGDTLGLFK